MNYRFKNFSPGTLFITKLNSSIQHTEETTKSIFKMEGNILVRMIWMFQEELQSAADMA